MSLIKTWSADLRYDAIGGHRLTYCPDCGAPVIDSPQKLDEHRARRHTLRPVLTRLPTTKILRLIETSRTPRLSEEDLILCAACREGDCLCCDGGDCRCVCALELDEPIRKHRIYA